MGKITRETFACSECDCKCEFTIKEQAERPNDVLSTLLNSGNFCPNSRFKKRGTK